MMQLQKISLVNVESMSGEDIWKGALSRENHLMHPASLLLTLVCAVVTFFGLSSSYVLK